jgi:predicted ATP-grasp superfamily ATP-dependent carboligase
LARVLVLDGHSAAALAFVRSLGRAGHWIAVGTNAGAAATAEVSRYCRASFRHPVSTEDTSGFLDAVAQFARLNSIDLIIPATDWTTLPLSAHRASFEGISRLAIGPHAALELSSDKYETVVLGKKLGVPVPETALARSPSDLPPTDEWHFPVVVKDRFSARWVGNRASIGSVVYAYSERNLRQRLADRLAVAGDVLLQEFVQGAGVGFSCFAIEGEIRLPFQWLRVREADPRGSGSSARKSVAVDPDILTFSRDLIRAVGFEGICMVEFKRQPDSGRAVLMEINGRPWGSLQLPVESGIDYPRFFVDWHLEGKLPPPEIAYRRGVMCRRVIGELRHLEHLWRGTPAGWPVPYPNFFASAMKMAVPWYPGVRYDDFWFSDPRPGWEGIWQWIRQRGNRERAGAGKVAKT